MEDSSDRVNLTHKDLEAIKVADSRLIFAIKNDGDTLYVLDGNGAHMVNEIAYMMLNETILREIILDAVDLFNREREHGMQYSPRLN